MTTMTAGAAGPDPAGILLRADEDGLPPITVGELRLRADLERTLRPGRDRMRAAGRILPYLPGLLDLLEQRSEGTAGGA